jgi:hypothetical protein
MCHHLWYGTFIPETAKKHPEVGFVVQMSDPKGPKTVASYTMVSWKMSAISKAFLPAR